ncbi:hypothetical protein HJD18_06880 [Thermoleophilia bacterium SCSIO 60948]|nr:hypothetical protein HJD18_06880 [Thermoleophilia bacterium SCSIO 60948]
MLLALSVVGLFFLPDPWRLILFGVALVVEVGEVFLWIRFLERYRVRTGAESMIGAEAEALDPLDPEGRVRIRGHEVWNAKASDTVAAGERVEVTAVEGLRLRVRRVGGPGQDPV